MGDGDVHLSNELLLRLRPEIAMHGRLDFKELLDDIFQVVCCC